MHVHLINIVFDMFLLLDQCWPQKLNRRGTIWPWYPLYNGYTYILITVYFSLSLFLSFSLSLFLSFSLSLSLPLSFFFSPPLIFSCYTGRPLVIVTMDKTQLNGVLSVVIVHPLLDSLAVPHLPLLFVSLSSFS